jgi:tRNA(Arg) A34 adenosine deaminase TadA
MVLGMRGDDVASLEVSIEQRRVAGHAEVVALREAAATLGNYRCVLLRFV